MVLLSLSLFLQRGDINKTSLLWQIFFFKVKFTAWEDKRERVALPLLSIEGGKQSSSFPDLFCFYFFFLCPSSTMRQKISFFVLLTPLLCFQSLHIHVKFQKVIIFFGGGGGGKDSTVNSLYQIGILPLKRFWLYCTSAYLLWGQSVPCLALARSDDSTAFSGGQRERERWGDEESFPPRPPGENWGGSSLSLSLWKMTPPLPSPSHPSETSFSASSFPRGLSPRPVLGVVWLAHISDIATSCLILHEKKFVFSFYYAHGTLIKHATAISERSSRWRICRGRLDLSEMAVACLINVPCA